MSLVKRLRTGIAAIALALTLNSCVTSNWIYRGGDSNYIRSEVKEETKGTVETTEKSFSFGDWQVVEDSGNGHYIIPIFESSKGQRFLIKEKSRIDYFSKSNTYVKESTGYGLNIFFGLAGLAAGIALMGKEPAIGLGALLAGAGLGIALPPITTEAERKKEFVGSSPEVSSSEEFSEFLGYTNNYSNRPASQITWGFKGETKTFQSGYDGNIILTLDENDEAATKKSLEKIIENFPIIQQISSEIRPWFIQGILDGSQERIRATIETRESSREKNTTIKNASKEFEFVYYKVKEEVIYSLIKEFVLEKIAPSIGELKVTNRDEVTRIPISGYNLEFISNAPEKSKLVETYFTGELRNYAEKFIPDYLIGEGELKGLESKSLLQVYFPSKLQIQITHKDYYFLQGILNLESNLPKKSSEVVAYMAEKGTKITMGPQSESLGKLTEVK